MCVCKLLQLKFMDMRIRRTISGPFPKIIPIDTTSEHLGLFTRACMHTNTHTRTPASMPGHCHLLKQVLLPALQRKLRL